MFSEAVLVSRTKVFSEAVLVSRTTVFSEAVLVSRTTVFSEAVLVSRITVLAAVLVGGSRREGVAESLGGAEEDARGRFLWPTYCVHTTFPARGKLSVR